MKNNKQQQELLERLLLLMSYDQKQTFTENLSKVKKTLEEKDEQNDPGPILYDNIEVITMPSGRQLRIPSYENSAKFFCKPNPEHWNNVVIQKKVPKDKSKAFVDKVIKELSNPDRVCNFSTPDGKRWCYNYQWSINGDKAYVPNNYYFENCNVDQDFYYEKNYVKITAKTNNVKVKDAGNVKKVQANPNIGIVGPLDSSGNELPENTIKVDNVETPTFVKWKIYNNTNKPMYIRNIKIKNLPIQYQDKLTWDKNKVIDENGEFLEVFLDLTYKQDKPDKPKETNNVETVKNATLATVANVATGGAALPVIVDKLAPKLNEQTQEEKPSRLTPFEGKIKLPSQSFELDLDTNFGNAFQNVIVDESPQVKYQTTNKVLKDRALNRKSVYGEKNVPDGYSPFTYDEYLQRKGELDKFILGFGESTPTGKAITPNVINKLSPDNKEYYDELTKRIRDLGYNSKFPKGITPEDKEIFSSTKQKYEKELGELESQLEKLKDSYYIESTDPMGGTYGDYNSQMYKDKDYISMTERIKKLKEELKTLDYRYGYDNRNWFDKFWDDYGLTIQIGLALLTAVLTFGASAPASTGFIASMLARAGIGAAEAAQMGAVARSLSALDTYMNVGLGTYFAIKGDGLNAIMSLFFALLPKIHTLYGKIGDFFGPKISAETAERLQQIFANTVIKSQDDLNAILAQLSNAERKYVYAFMKTPDNIIGDALKAAQDDMNRIAAAEGKQAAETLQINLAGSKLASAGKLVTVLAVDYAIIKNMDEMYSAVIAKLNCFCRSKKGKPCTEEQNTPQGRKGTIEDFEKYKYDCLVTEEERQQWKSYLSKLSPIEFENLKSLLNLIALKTTPEGQAVIERGILRNGVSDNTLKTAKTLEVKEAMDKLEKSGIDKDKYVDDFMAELERQAQSNQDKPLDVPIDKVTNGKITTDQIDNLLDDKNTTNKVENPTDKSLENKNTNNNTKI